MLSNKMVQALFGFNQATNARLWAIIMEHLTDAQFTEEIDYSRGSIRNQLVHMADAQRYWFRNLLDLPDLPEIRMEDYTTRAAARAICQQADQECVDHARTLSDGDLERIPEIWSQPVWVGLVQVAQHSTDHRAQILHALHALGAPTLEQNFAIYMENATPMTMEDVRREIDAKRGEWDALLGQVPAEQMNQPLLEGWTVRDVVAILTWKERQLTETIGRRVYTNISFGELAETEQRRILEANRALPLEELHEQHQAAHREMLDALQALSDDDLNSEERIEGLPPDDRFWKAIAAATWWSYPSFSEALRQFVSGNAASPAD